MRSLFLNSIAALFFLSLANCQEYSRQVEKETGVSFSFEGQVIAVKDGDTFVILSDKSEKTIRLAHIDCPEKRQPFGTRAKQFAADLCFGKIVKVKTEGKQDRNKRVIGELLLADGTNVNKELVKQGLAWHYKKYSESEEYAQLENGARAKRVGLWVDEYPRAPWEWRRKR